MSGPAGYCGPLNPARCHLTSPALLGGSLRLLHRLCCKNKALSAFIPSLIWLSAFTVWGAVIHSLARLWRGLLNHDPCIIRYISPQYTCISCAGLVSWASLCECVSLRVLNKVVTVPSPDPCVATRPAQTTQLLVYTVEQ